MQKITDNNITLIESSHRYVLKDDPEFNFTSCTTFANYFFEPFDSIGIANNLTSTHPSYIDLTPQELVAKWDRTAKEGTLVHAEIEDFINKNADPSHAKSKVAVEWVKNNLNARDKYYLYPEVIIYSKELSLAGTIDLLVYDKVEGTYKLIDWKTGKKIEDQAYKNKMGNHPSTSHLMDCNLIHYSVQLSLYRFLLEKYYGLNVSELVISHLTDNNVEIHKTEYYKREVEEMLKADRDSLRKYAEDCLTTEFI